MDYEILGKNVFSFIIHADILEFIAAKFTLNSAIVYIKRNKMINKQTISINKYTISINKQAISITYFRSFCPEYDVARVKKKVNYIVLAYKSHP